MTMQYTNFEDVDPSLEARQLKSTIATSFRLKQNNHAQVNFKSG